MVSADRSFYTYYFCTNLYFSTNDSKHKEQEHTQIENLTNTKEYHASSNDTLWKRKNFLKHLTETGGSSGKFRPISGMQCSVCPRGVGGYNPQWLRTTPSLATENFGLGVDFSNIWPSGNSLYHTLISVRVFPALRCPKSCGRSGLHCGPHWKSLQRSPDSLAGGEGAWCPVPPRKFHPRPLCRNNPTAC